jgi:hypothetical protein
MLVSGAVKPAREINPRASYILSSRDHNELAAIEGTRIGGLIMSGDRL